MLDGSMDPPSTLSDMPTVWMADQHSHATVHHGHHAPIPHHVPVHHAPVHHVPVHHAPVHVPVHHAPVVSVAPHPAPYAPAPAPVYKPAPAYHEPAYKEEPKPYAFQYGVADDYSGAKFSAQEAADGKAVTGSYQVALPDGRVQTVTYTADHYNGYVADVKYEGTP